MRERILFCPRELYGKLSIKGLTMNDIAKKSGISKRTQYEHTNCKEEPLSECLQFPPKNCKLVTPTALAL